MEEKTHWELNTESACGLAVIIHRHWKVKVYYISGWFILTVGGVVPLAKPFISILSPWFPRTEGEESWVRWVWTDHLLPSHFRWVMMTLYSWEGWSWCVFTKDSVYIPTLWRPALVQSTFKVALSFERPLCKKRRQIAKITLDLLSLATFPMLISLSQAEMLPDMA